NAPDPPGIYTLSLHDALPIWRAPSFRGCAVSPSRRSRRVRGRFVTMPYFLSIAPPGRKGPRDAVGRMSLHYLVGPRIMVGGDLVDRKSTRLNSSHVEISYAVF